MSDKDITIINYIHEIGYPRMDAILRKMEGKTFRIVVEPKNNESFDSWKKLEDDIKEEIKYLESNHSKDFDIKIKTLEGVLKEMKRFKPSGDGIGGGERPTDSATEKTGTTGVEVESHAHVAPAPETPEGKCKYCGGRGMVCGRCGGGECACGNDLIPPVPCPYCNTPNIKVNVKLHCHLCNTDFKTIREFVDHCLECNKMNVHLIPPTIPIKIESPEDPDIEKYHLRERFVHCYICKEKVSLADVVAGENDWPCHKECLESKTDSAITIKDLNKDIEGKCICLRCSVYELCPHSPCGPGGVTPVKG